MKPILVSLICLVAVFAAPARSAERVLLEWDFSKASDPLGWVAAEKLDEYGVIDGALVATAGINRQKLESPLFSIEARPWQYVEVDMATDEGGLGYMYYSNTTEPPYRGFRTGQYVQFAVNGGDEFATYRIMPFWQRHGKMVHIRLDPPGRRVRIGAIRIMEVQGTVPSQSPSWRFIKGDGDWISVPPGLEVTVTTAGCRITGRGDMSFLSPPIDIESDDNLWATVRLGSNTEHVVLLRWASSEHDGLRALPIAVRGDGRMHSYSVNLGDSGDWVGRISCIGLTPSDGHAERTVLLESVNIGSAPSGPAEVFVTRLGLREPFVRAGQKATLLMDLRNAGGEPTPELAAKADLHFRSLERARPDTREGIEAAREQPSKPQALTLRKTVASIKPGETVRVEWEITGDLAGESAVTASVSGQGIQPEQAQSVLRFHPRLRESPLLDPDLRGQRYVPPPNPADTGEYLVGAYYFPGWHTYPRWSVLEDFPERTPVLGYYREGSPEVADWHILWALEHGIRFFIYDWYWDEGKRQLEHGLHDGFLKARYSDQMDFCLLWANHNPPAKNARQDMLDVTRYWIDNYFRRPNYLKVDGKNVMVIFSTQRLTEDLGSGVKAAFDEMRRMCEDAGVGGLYLVGCTYPGTDHIKNLVSEGYDALSGYNYPMAGNRDQRRAPYEWMVEGYKDFWTRIADASSVPYIPVCDPGWDSRPWHGEKGIVRTGKTPQLWKQMLQNAKAFVDDPARAKPDGRKMVFLEAWNEFGEGDYIEPHAEFGFDHIEMVRQVFAPSGKAPEIVVPHDVGMGPYEVDRPAPQTAWEFSRKSDQTWYVGNMINLDYSRGVMSAVAANSDPAFYSPGIRVDADKLRTVEIKMKMDKGDEGQFFFSRPMSTMTEPTSVRFPVTADGKFHIYRLDLGANRRWRGTMGAVRIDPNNVEGSNVEVEYVRFQ